jgi:glycosyltransferase involved in cell wall biosynthesis
LRTVLVVNDARFFLTHRLSLAKGIRAQGYDVHIGVPDSGRYTSEIQGEGFPVHKLAIQRQGLNPAADLAALGQMLALYRDLRPDLVHHVTIKPLLYGAIAARITGTPAVVSAISGLGRLFSRQTTVEAARSTLVQSVYRAFLRHPNMCVIFQNDEDRMTFQQAGIARDADSIVLPGSGTTLESFSHSPEPESEPIVVLPGRLLKQKGIREFATAAAILRDRGVKARFVLVGDTAGNRDAVSDESLLLWQRSGILEWWGWSDDLPEVFSRSSVVCLPSYHEGAPKALLDACAAGRPIVATDIAGCRVAVEHGVNGLLVPPRDPQSLAQALSKLLTNKSLREELGREGRRIAEERFDVSRVVTATLGVYERLISRAARAKG